MKIRGNPSPKCFQFWKSYFFLSPGSHKPVSFNALWKQFKMVNKRKMIDADKHFSFVHKLSHNKELLSYFVTNLSGKIVNFCKLSPKAENVTGKQFFGSVILRPQLVMTWYQKHSYREILGLVFNPV